MEMTKLTRAFWLTTAAVLLIAATVRCETMYVTAFGQCRVVGYQAPFATGMEGSAFVGNSDGCTPSGRPVDASHLSGPNISEFVNGNLIVADSGNSRLIGFSLPSTNASILFGQRSFSQRSVGHGMSRLNHVGGLAYDPPTDMIAIVDSSNGRVMLFEHPFGNQMQFVAILGQKRPNQGSGNFDGAPSCWGDAGSFYALNVGRASDRTLCNPAAAAFDASGNLWVAEEGNSRVALFTRPFTNYEPISVVLGQPDAFSNHPGLGPNRLAAANDLGFDLNGNLWVADWENGRAVRFPAPLVTGESADALVGQPDFNTRLSTAPYGFKPACHHHHAASASQLCDASGVAVSPEGDLMVSDFDFNRVLAFHPGQTAAFACIGQRDCSTTWSPVGPASLSQPVGIVFQP